MIRNKDQEHALSTELNQTPIAPSETLSPSTTNVPIPFRRHEASATNSSPSSTVPPILYFLSLFYAFLCMGFGTGITTSTFLKLGEQTNSTIDQLTSLFFTRSCGFFSGTTLAGVFFDRFHRFGNMFLAIAVLMMSATTLLIPFTYQLILLLPLQLAWGIAAGSVDNLTQVLTMRYCSSRNVGPYLQALHSAFGIGAFVSPLIVAQFLSKRHHHDRWHYAYFIVFLLHLPALIWLSYYSIGSACHGKGKSKYKHTSEPEIEEFLSTNPAIVDHFSTQRKTKPVKRQLLFVLLLAPFLFCYVGGQYGFISYLGTYATLHFRFSKGTAAYLNSAFWASFVVGRLCGIVFSLKISPQKMLFGSLTGCIASLILLMVCNKLSLILWIGSILFALFIASIYSSTIAYGERHITITGKRMSLLTVAGALGDAVIPLLVGVNIKSTLFGYPNFIIVTLSIFILASILWVLNVLCIARSSALLDTNVIIETSDPEDSSLEPTLK